MTHRGPFQPLLFCDILWSTCLQCQRLESPEWVKSWANSWSGAAAPVVSISRCQQMERPRSRGCRWAECTWAQLLDTSTFLWLGFCCSGVCLFGGFGVLFILGFCSLFGFFCGLGVFPLTGLHPEPPEKGNSTRPLLLFLFMRALCVSAHADLRILVCTVHRYPCASAYSEYVVGLATSWTGGTELQQPRPCQEAVGFSCP